MIQTLMQGFVVPALRNLREERGTRFVGTVKEIKGRATRPTPIQALKTFGHSGIVQWDLWDVCDG